MSLFVKPPPDIEMGGTLDSSGAMDIYNLFASGKSPTQLFIEDGIPFHHSIQVRDEMLRIEREARGAMEQANQPSTKAQLIGKVDSNLLELSTVIDDVIQYHPVYKVDRTFAAFKASFDVEV